jgi:hypothetical protein
LHHLLVLAVALELEKELAPEKVAQVHQNKTHRNSLHNSLLLQNNSHSHRRSPMQPSN